MGKILIITHESGGDVATAIQDILDGEVRCCDFTHAGSVLNEFQPDCVVIESWRELETDLAWIESLKQFDDHLPIVMVSDYRDLQPAVALVKKGVTDIFSNPLDVERFKKVVERALKTYELTQKIFTSDDQGSGLVVEGMIGAGPRMREVAQMISAVAKSDATVLITGDSGTGKELVAKAIHQHSKRVGGRFVDINCGAIPRELLENELFGHERGSFTGADRRYIGCCERADKGTLFLDEICEMEPALQVKILRMLQERTFNRVGGNDRVEVDVRFIAATNRDVLTEVRNGRFREDLYYRLNVVPIHLPLLRERREDIPLLARHFLEKFSQKNEKMFVDIDADAMESLVNYDWPGNVRELENTIERSVVLANDSLLKARHLPPHIQAVERKIDLQSVRLPSDSIGDVLPLEMVERNAIEAALRSCDGNISEAARKLKIGQATIYRKIKQYGLNR